MDIRYDEWLPSPALKGIVTAYWRVAGDGSRLAPSPILPDGHVELVLNLGDPVHLSGPAYIGLQPERVIVGMLSHTLWMEYRGLINMFGVRFHPARGAAFLGQPAASFAGRLVPLAEACDSLEVRICRFLEGKPSLETESARRALDQELLDHLPSALPQDELVVAMVDRLTTSKDPPLVAEIAKEVGISSRQLQRRFRAAVGMAPKRFVRVLRFARAWQEASMRPPEGWAELAVEYGFADQAHLVREFRAFGAAAPTRVFTSEWYQSTEISRASGPAKGVRSVQDSQRPTR